MNNKTGGQKGKKTNLERHGKDFYKVIGSKGGKVKAPKGFAVSGKASEAGKLGGATSRRGKATHPNKRREIVELHTTTELTPAQIGYKVGSKPHAVSRVLSLWKSKRN